MELIMLVIVCLLVYASWAAILSNNLFHRTWSLALLFFPFLFISVWRQPPSSFTLFLTTLLLLDFAICVALSPVRLLFRSKHDIEKHNALDVIHEEPDAVVDIVVVHGLAARPNETWKARPAKSPDVAENTNPPPALMWLRDLLPEEKDLRCRILAFNHNTAWERNSLSKTLGDHSLDLLRALGIDSDKQEDKERPIVFIGHSFGGIIIKQVSLLCPYLLLLLDNVDSS
ncbi:hypothetical protein F4680DRAFT_179746 [Xylaria scruposa]|nr:hypothetical protein F4680DRAFT_179746 [Xylaria scruposa]